MTVVAGKSLSIGAIVAAVGGVLAIIGAFLVWYSATIGKSLGGPETAEAKGIDNLAGKLALVLGIVVIALVVAWIMSVKIPYLSAIIVAVGVAILVVLALSYVTDIFSVRFTPPAKEESVKDVLDAFNKAVDDAKKAGLDVSGSSASFGIGFILEAVAGIAVIVGGALGLRKKAA